MKISNFKLAIGFPCSWPFVPFPFFRSFILMERPEFTPIFATNGPIDGLRNKIVQDAMAIGASHLIMMEMDQTYPTTVITELLKHKLPLVGAMVHRRYPPFDPLMLKGDINTYECIEDWEPSTLQEVDATGTGCLLFNMQLFYDMDARARAEIAAINKSKPTADQMIGLPGNVRKYLTEMERGYIPEHTPGQWFKFRPNPDPKYIGIVGEDIGFCSDLRKAGHKIYVDTSIKCGHLSTMEITEETYWLYKSLKKKQEAKSKTE